MSLRKYSEHGSGQINSHDMTGFRATKRVSKYLMVVMVVVGVCIFLWLLPKVTTRTRARNSTVAITYSIYCSRRCKARRLVLYHAFSGGYSKNRKIIRAASCIVRCVQCVVNSGALRVSTAVGLRTLISKNFTKHRFDNDVSFVWMYFCLCVCRDTNISECSFSGVVVCTT